MSTSTRTAPVRSLCLRLLTGLVPAAVLVGVVEAAVARWSYPALAQYAQVSPAAFAARLTALSCTAALGASVAVASLAPICSAMLGRLWPRRLPTGGTAVALAGSFVGMAMLGVLAPLALNVAFPAGISADRTGPIARLAAVTIALTGGVVFGALCRRVAASRPGSRRQAITATLALMAAGYAVYGPWGVALPPPPTPPRSAALAEPPLVDRSLVLVSVDTLRASHMSLYGYGRETTPRIDAWAAGAAVFDAAITPKGYTAPALASLSTGLYPYAHGVQRHPAVVDDNLATIAELFEQAGYRTAAFVTNPAVTDRTFGFDQGFAEWTTYRAREASAERILGDAQTWLEATDQRPFLLWIHLIDPHTPYRPPAPFDTRFVGDARYDDYAGTAIEPVEGRASDFEFAPSDTLGHDWRELGVADEHLRNPDWLIAQYDGEIAYMDASLGPFLEGVRRTHPEAATLLTADHGESMVEHGYLFAHGLNCYDPVARIPLAISWAGLSARRIGAPASLADVLPTLVDLFDLELPTLVEGRSLAELLASGVAGDAPVGAGSPRTGSAATEADGAGVMIEARNTGAYMSVGVRTADRKLVLRPRRSLAPFDALMQIQLQWLGRADIPPAFLRSYAVELYALDDDPAELHDVSAGDPEAVRRLSARVWSGLHRGYLMRLARGSSSAGGVEVDAETLQELRDLGYIR